MVTMNITSNNLWELPITVTASGDITKTLNTAGTFLDRNIGIKVSTPKAVATVSASKKATAPTVARTTTTVSGATNVANGNATTTAPSSGYFISIQATAPATTLDITKTVNTAGYLGTNTQITASAATTANTGSIYYVPVAPSTPTTSYSINSGWNTYFDSASDDDYHISITPKYSNTAGYVSAHTDTNNGGTGYWKIKTTSIDQGTSTISNNTVTRGAVSWGTGWITTNSISPASFANTATADVTYLDISNTTEAPMLSSSGYLYINKGYTDNLKISLAKLIPDWPNGTSVAVNDKILSGYKAYDQDGNVLTGSIATITLPTSASSNITSGYTSKATIGRSTSDQYINIPPGYNSSGAYYKISKVANGSAKTPATTITANPSGSVNSSGLVTMSVIASQNITPTVTAGYISSGTAGTVTVSGSNTLQLDNVNGSLGGTASAGSASAIINNINNINTTNSPTGTAGTDYWQIKATATGSNGSYTPKYTVTTAGWLESTVNGIAQTIIVNGDTTGQSLYIPKATMTVAGTNAVSPTASITGAQTTLVITNNSGISVTATGGGTASVTAIATTNAAGYAPASTQLGSATLNATNKTTTTTQYLKEVEIIKPSSGSREFGIKVPNGDSTITFVFHVDSSGNVTVDNEYSLTY